MFLFIAPPEHILTGSVCHKLCLWYFCTCPREPRLGYTVAFVCRLVPQGFGDCVKVSSGNRLDGLLAITRHEQEEAEQSGEQYDLPTSGIEVQSMLHVPHLCHRTKSRWNSCAVAKVRWMSRERDERGGHLSVEYLPSLLVFISLDLND